MQGDNNHIKTYTAQDIDRYLNRQMSAAEMHALEKAALEDPFLAEAIEGYVNTPPGSVQKDIEKLVSALDEKTATRVVSIGFKKWMWSAAAAVIILLGVATTWYWLRPSADSPIAEQKETPATPRVEPGIAKDSAGPATAPAGESTAIPSPTEKKAVPSPLPSATLADENAEKSPARREEDYKKTDTVKSKAQPAEKEKELEAASKEPDNLYLKRKQTTDIPRGDVAAAAAQAEDQRSVSGYFAPRIFSGKITDDKNKTLPFVNISIPNTPASTYSDAQGNFRLTSADTQLVVQLKSVGFEEKKVTLYSNVSNNMVQLMPSENSLAEITVTGYGINRKKNMPAAKQVKQEEADKEQEAEPKDGWAAYDAYMMNNSRLPDANGHSALKGTVELSFIVNKYGVLSDFRVELSSCAVCEKEAVRLIKEGPAWKLVSGDKPARVTLTMHF
ncbi:MAG: carboxypeptidase-like regulatory domain-containing protein [Chitinophagaceae bacterium]|nr:carboxypeptidase-like regulatory domain-containing protein [Chitinophagaceae bacterium]